MVWKKSCGTPREHEVIAHDWIPFTRLRTTDASLVAGIQHTPGDAASPQQLAAIQADRPLRPARRSNPLAPTICLFSVSTLDPLN